jgi:hypothetical protein
VVAVALTPEQVEQVDQEAVARVHPQLLLPHPEQQILAAVVVVVITTARVLVARELLFFQYPQYFIRVQQRVHLL